MRAQWEHTQGKPRRDRSAETSKTETSRSCPIAGHDHAQLIRATHRAHRQPAALPTSRPLSTWRDGGSAGARRQALGRGGARTVLGVAGRLGARCGRGRSSAVPEAGEGDAPRGVGNIPHVHSELLLVSRWMGGSCQATMPDMPAMTARPPTIMPPPIMSCSAHTHPHTHMPTAHMYPSRAPTPPLDRVPLTAERRRSTRSCWRWGARGTWRGRAPARCADAPPPQPLRPAAGTPPAPALPAPTPRPRAWPGRGLQARVRQKAARTPTGSQRHPFFPPPPPPSLWMEGRTSGSRGRARGRGWAGQGRASCPRSSSAPCRCGWWSSAGWAAASATWQSGFTCRGNGVALRNCGGWQGRRGAEEVGVQACGSSNLCNRGWSWGNLQFGGGAGYGEGGSEPVYA